MKFNLFLLSAAALVNAATATDAVNLGTAGNYVILTKSGISTVPDSDITGDIAVSPIAADAITGFNLTLDSDERVSVDSTLQVAGFVYASDYSAPTPAILSTAVSDMETAYTDAAGRTNTNAARINLAGGLVGGLTLTPGIYTFQVDIYIATDITLSGGPNDVFIIQTTKNVVQAADTKVTLDGGVLASNVFWQVAGDVSVGTGAAMEGVLLVQTAVTFKTGSSLNGRILAQKACALQKATIFEVSKQP
jgi:hypothetical protein